MTQGVLLVNLGTPKSSHRRDVFRYLIEFLTDGRVIDLPFLFRQLLVRGVIVPRRYKQSAKSFEKVWTEEGSPLLIYGRKVTNALQDALGSDYRVELAMRYQEPSIKEGLEKLRHCASLLILPLFPQYASATSGSIYQKVMEEMASWQTHPHVSFVSEFATHPAFIQAYCTIAKRYPLDSYDHILFSFHGLPMRHIRKADPHGRCLTKGCCDTEQHFCYASQCHATKRAICDTLSLPKEKTSICFQSRLGRDPWLTPYTSDVIDALRKEGKKRLLVLSPAFVCDCLETLYEIGIEGRDQFLSSGGSALDLVSGLNDEAHWIAALVQMIHLQK